ncbi:tripartite tricarboxylate transporter substrate binding protein [Alkalihalophilus marmarensis]|uniref:tripartite tricarboxylate transporter substrate binding protein n=1 Tax=Alkalihalophilus marmarensis TaxID=521377 RepID=UPI002DC05664|nr:tripartite tricarboxylate transporter substrate binding protein [Alkalihalophilus marmarensis]MEC2071337.1 tripartite tricarboxylate transporter substrate binding protein [Alkalihalophilus marmarensis]
MFKKPLFLLSTLLLSTLVACGSSDTQGGASEGQADNEGGETAIDYPTKTINMIVPWGAGGDTDVIYRVTNEYLSEELDGVNFVVTNIGGGGGSIGAQEALNEDPDGYTLLAGHDSIGLSELMGNTSFSYFDFEPVALLTSASQIIATSVQNDWESMEDVVAELKENPGSISFGAAFGSTSHTLPLGIEDAADVKFNIVNYEGTSQRTTALLGNHVGLGATTVPAAQEYIKADQLKLLGISSAERNPALPEVPTLIEQGIDAVNATNRGYFFPKGTPQEIVELMSDAIGRVAENPEFIAQMEEMGVEVVYKPHDEYSEWLETSNDYLAEMLERQGIVE